MAEPPEAPKNLLIGRRTVFESQRDRALRPAQNELLARLPRHENLRLSPHLKWTWLKRGRRIYKPGQPITHLYFPLDCLAAEVIGLKDGRTGHIALIGKEGCVGLDSIMGSDRARAETVVLYPGRAYRL